MFKPTPPRSAAELRAIRAERLRRLYEAMGTPSTEQLQQSASPTASHSSGKARARDSSDEDWPSSAASSAAPEQVAAVFNMPDSETFAAIPIESKGTGEKYDRLMREMNRSNITTMYQQAIRALPRSHQLPSLQMEVLDLPDEDLEFDTYGTSMVERHINEVLRAEGEEPIKLPVIKYRDWSLNPPLAVYEPEQGHPEVVGRRFMARLKELSTRTPALYAKIVFWLYELEHYLLLAPILHSRSDVATLLG